MIIRGFQQYLDRRHPADHTRDATTLMTMGYKSMVSDEFTPLIEN